MSTDIRLYEKQFNPESFINCIVDDRSSSRGTPCIREK